MTTENLGCAKCGACCQNLTITADPTVGSLEHWTTKALENVPDPREDWGHWAAHGWTDGQRELAERRYDPDGDLRADVDFIADHWHEIDGYPGNYRCDRWDPATLLCTAHDERPPVCRNFPWYGAEPGVARAASLDSACSFLLDVPPAARPEGARPLIPIEVIR